MFTVVIYYNEDAGEKSAYKKIDLEKYNFLFSYADREKRIIRKAYAGDLEQIISELNQDIREVCDWKLILFDGRLMPEGAENDTEFSAPDIMRREWNRLMFCLSGQGCRETKIGLQGTRPKEVWYLSCWSKGVYYAADRNEFSHAKLRLTRQEYREIYPDHDMDIETPSADLESESKDIDKSEQSQRKSKEKDVTVDILDVLDISCLRMCWIELGADRGIQRKQEELQIGCTLLILACNDIPASFLVSGYLYKISIGIDRSKLAQYIGRLRQQNMEREEQYERELKKYDREGQTVAYIKPEKAYFHPIDSFNWSWDRKKRRLACKDLRRGNDLGLDIKLRDNQQWLYQQLYFFNDYLHDAVVKPINIEKGNKGVLLDASGEATIRAALQDALHTIRSERQAEDNPLNIEKKLQEEEHRVRSRMERRLDALELKRVRMVLSWIEGIAFAVFGVGVIKVIWHNWGQEFPFSDFISSILAFDIGRSVLHILAFIFSSAILALLVEAALGIISAGANIYTCIKYNGYIKNIHKDQQKKRENVNKLMEGIAKYQYHWALYNEKFEIQAEREKRKECLRRHALVRRNVADVCSSLEGMLDADERIGVEWMLLPDIDFSKNPEQADYYWVPFVDHGEECTLNNTGREIEVVFDFIVSFGIHGTPVLRIVRD